MGVNFILLRINRYYLLWVVLIFLLIGFAAPLLASKVQLGTLHNSTLVVSLLSSDYKNGSGSNKNKLLTSVVDNSGTKFSKALAYNPIVSNGKSILVVSGASNKFSQYFTEILLAEGLNSYSSTDISSVTLDVLSTYDIVIVGNIPLTDAQVSVLSTWVNAGGILIASKPDAKLGTLLGISPDGGTLANSYLLVNTSTGPGKGIVNQTIQFQGVADLYNVNNGTNKLATLYSTASNSTNYPAVTARAVGNNGGVAVSFTYDLARSVVYTRQGNPQWAGQKRDGQPGPIRSDDQFYPDWIDLNKVMIPQADEQQRLLANIITLYLRKPVPRFWYLPRGLKAAVVMTGDDHGNGGTKARFNQYLQLSEDNSEQAVADWRAIRGTSYIYPLTPITDSEAKSFEQQGFEVALHLNTNCSNYTPTSLEQDFTTQLAEFKTRFPSVAAPSTNRTHCIAWSDWSTQPQVERPKGIRLDANYYYWPSPWVQNRPGMFTGSGIPMRFTDLQGGLIDVYQLTTQMTDESDQVFPFTIDQLLNKALGTEGYYGVFCANMHTDAATSSGSDAIIASAKARNVPVISSKQLLSWLDGRNGSSFSEMSWNGNELSFTVNVANGARNLEGMLPMTETTGKLVGLSVNGAAATYRIEVIKGIEYAFFPCRTGNYVATYNTSAPPNQAPVITITSPANNSTFDADASITIKTNASDTDGSVSKVEFYNGTNKLGEDLTSPYEFAWTKVAAGIHDITAKATDDKGAITTSAIVRVTVNAAPVMCPCSVFRSSDAPTGIMFNDGQGLQLGMKFRSSVNGFITGVRFYKQSGNTSTHTGQLYTSTGMLVGSVAFNNETASGWQQAEFSTPVAITANTTYIISYHSSNGQYAATNPYFTQAISNGPLRALVNGEDGPNGVYKYSSTPAFPNDNYLSANYWVDVVFTPDGEQGNKAPVISITAPANNTSFTAPASIAISASATDTDGLVSKVEFYNGNTKLGEDTEGSNGWNFTWTNVTAGNYTLTARATDDKGATTTSSAVNIAVNATDNRPPVLVTPISDQFATIGVAYSYTFNQNTFSDPDGDPLTYTVSLANGATLPSWLTFNSSTRTFSGTPPAGSQGQISINLLASDGRGGTANDNFLLTIGQAGNQAPVLASIGNKNVTELSLLTFTASATDDGLAGNSLSYSVTSSVTEATINPVTGVFSWTPTEAQGPGSYNFTIKVTDGELTDEETIVVQVTEANQVPVLAFVGNKEIGVGQILSFSLQGSDADLPKQTLTYSANKLPAGATLNSGTGQFSWAPTSKQVGSHKIIFRVSDGVSQSSESIVITVKSTPVTTAPVISGFSPSSGKAGDQVIISGTNFNEVSAVLFNGVSAAFNINGATSITAFVPAGATTGKISITSPGGTAISDAVFTVSGGTGAAPSVSIISPSNGSSFNSPATISIIANASDNDGAVTIVEFFQGSTKIGEDRDGTDGWSLAWNSVSAGNYALTCRATDNDGLTATSGVVNISVVNASSGPPSITSFSPTSGPVGERVIIIGNNLATANKVTFGPSNALFTVNSNGSLEAIVPTVNGKLPTSVKITVSTPGGNSTTTNKFIITPGATASMVSTLQQPALEQDNELAVYPNPFSEKATISIKLQRDSDYELRLYDYRGALVSILKQGDAKAGEQYDIEVNGSQLAKGLYLVRLQTKTGFKTTKLVLAK
ncbi:Ig-like domain-containing protein [Pontibacter burrus]|uniref:DUF4082 domain-containing protein n=1 Tax=Pontibacter burrus TaxID=2704466 RepID=A0A6B3LVZ4_9BACT|nr:DUF4082 domain-containing protein [Pontibacter burrus]NEM97760.1 DUF4082 domain-containing protein [Pontibacter burrus]